MTALRPTPDSRPAREQLETLLYDADIGNCDEADMRALAAEVRALRAELDAARAASEQVAQWRGIEHLELARLRTVAAAAQAYVYLDSADADVIDIAYGHLVEAVDDAGGERLAVLPIAELNALRARASGPDPS